MMVLQLLVAECKHVVESARLNIASAFLAIKSHDERLWFCGLGVGGHVCVGILRIGCHVGEGVVDGPLRRVCMRSCVLN